MWVEIVFEMNKDNGIDINAAITTVINIVARLVVDNSVI